MSNNNSTTGVGFFGLLAIVFIALKLAGCIAWSWVWVLAPLWIGIPLAILFFLFLFMIGIIIGLIIAIAEEFG